jgi:nucleoside-diphosphate-sugar epimerase
MRNILITGGAGVLGSSLAKAFLTLGNNVKIIDITRKEECWRLIESDIINKVDYIWKSTNEISPLDIDGMDLIVDCAIGFPDRPFGTLSPKTTLSGNIFPAMGVLEAVRQLKEKPTIIYPSSFNALYGNSGIYDENTTPNPTTVYGWTKAAVEKLYLTYHHSFGIPIIITRVGSSYGEGMRTDELVARLIYAGIKRERFPLRSCQSVRLWTYIGDVVNAYSSIMKSSDYGRNNEFISRIKKRNYVINVAGNYGDEILTNVALAKIVSNVTGFEDIIEPTSEYEPGELVNNTPVKFEINAQWSRDLIKWNPKYTLKEGIESTANWFRKFLTEGAYLGHHERV